MNPSAQGLLVIFCRKANQKNFFSAKSSVLIAGPACLFAVTWQFTKTEPYAVLKMQQPPGL